MNKIIVLSHAVKQMSGKLVNFFAAAKTYTPAGKLTATEIYRVRYN